MRTRTSLAAVTLLAAALMFGWLVPTLHAQEKPSDYTFKGGFPMPETVQQTYDDADLNRAVQAYRFFYSTVFGTAIFKGSTDVGLEDNKECI